jgi:hypothetical protein
MSKSRRITADIVTPDTGDTVSLVPNPTQLDAPQLAQAIEQDISRFERTAKEAAFLALRIGIRLVWVRDNSQFGGLTKFLKQFDGRQSERTLKRYISVADRFLADAGLVEKRSRKLTNGDAIAPILSTQLELFTDPAAKFEGAMQKLLKWVGDRGLSDLYKEAAGSYTRRDDNGQITAGKGKMKSAAELAQEAEDEIAHILNLLGGWILATHHTRLPKDRRAIVEAVLTDAATKIRNVK